MIALFDFYPRFCPNCGAAIKLEGTVARDYGVAHCSFKCPADCGLNYQLADSARLVGAATASGGDLGHYVEMSS